MTTEKFNLIDDDSVSFPESHKIRDIGECARAAAAAYRQVKACLKDIEAPESKNSPEYNRLKSHFARLLTVAIASNALSIFGLDTCFGSNVFQWSATTFKDEVDYMNDRSRTKDVLSEGEFQYCKVMDYARMAVLADDKVQAAK